jgi:hypothetical protein
MLTSRNHIKVEVALDKERVNASNFNWLDCIRLTNPYFLFQKFIIDNK